MSKCQIEQHVRQVAENVLKEQRYVCAIDVLLGIGYLQKYVLVKAATLLLKKLIAPIIRSQ